MTRPPGPLLIALVVSLLVGAAAPATADIQYVYDALGRLVAVVDEAGNVASYTYDAVGNLLAIERLNPADLPDAVGITLVSPNKGKAGTPVQIFGKGFSATASENSVAFNGAPATVTAATPVSLTTAVPAGATTGPITVTTPLGSATSPTPFHVFGAITVSPTAVYVAQGATRQFEAFESGSPTTNVYWSVNGVRGGQAATGTISASGLFTAPAVVTAPLTVTVTATHKDDPTFSGSALATMQAAFLAGHAVSARVASSTAFTEAALVTVGIQPVVTGLSPASAAAGTVNLSLTLTGSGFTGATSVSVLRNNATDANITVSNLVVNSDSQATVTISIAAGAAIGARVVRITTPPRTSPNLGTGGNVFTVQ